MATDEKRIYQWSIELLADQYKRITFINRMRDEYMLAGLDSAKSVWEERSHDAAMEFKGQRDLIAKLHFKEVQEVLSDMYKYLRGDDE